MASSAPPPNSHRCPKLRRSSWATLPGPGARLPPLLPTSPLLVGTAVARDPQVAALALTLSSVCRGPLRLSDLHHQMIESIKGLPWQGGDPRRLLQSLSRLQQPRACVL